MITDKISEKFNFFLTERSNYYHEQQNSNFKSAKRHGKISFLMILNKIFYGFRLFVDIGVCTGAHVANLIFLSKFASMILCLL